MHIFSEDERNSSLVNIFFIAIAIQCFGLAIIWNGDRSALGKLLFSKSSLSDTAISGIENGLLVLLALCIWFALRKTRAILLPISFIFLLEAISKYLVGGNFGSAFAPFAHLGRWLPPLLVFFYVLRKLNNNNISIFLKIISSTVFITHGIEALMLNPIFIDYSLYFFSLVDLGITQKQTEVFLKGVGYIDIVLGIVILLPITRLRSAALLYMGFWGFWTACLRTVFLGPSGLGETLIRTMNWLIPVFIFVFLSKGDHDNEKKITPLFYFPFLWRGFIARKTSSPKGYLA